MFMPNLDILPEEQRRLWSNLGVFSQEMKFVLYGGTAVALQLGHRSSVDFDFFSSLEFKNQDVFDKLSFLNVAAVEQNEKNTFTVKTDTGVKLSFLGGISLGRVGTPRTADSNFLQVASLDDLMALKLAVITKRAQYKDYLDISVMVQNGISLAKGLASAKAMYSVSFQPAIALKALTYFQDGDLNRLKRRDREILLNAVKNVEVLPASQLIAKDLFDDGQVRRNELYRGR